MYWKALICVILLLCHHPLSSYGYGEPSASGHPSYQERANHVFLNAVRISPSQYKTVYMAGYSPSPANILLSYPAVPPVYLEPKLVASAYSHSNDMAVHNCFAHNSCDGTPTFTRIQSFYTCNGNMGENIAAGYSDPLATSNQWLCDETSGACAADGSGADGHRENMMSSIYKAVGVGYDYSASSTYKHYWTQDFGGAPCSPVPTNPIYGGSHRISGSNIKFIAVYYTNPSVSPSSAAVVIAGTSYTLSVDIGTTGGQATYAFTQAKGSACRSYYFTIGSSRYPDTGCLVTYGEGTCVTSFDATCGGTTAATTATSSSTATVATSSATSTVATTAAATTAATTSKTTTTTAATTAAVTTAAATSSSTSTTGSGSTYYLYSSSLQNSWVAYGNSGVTIVNPATYQSQTALSVTLTNSTNTMWFQFTHNPAVPKVWSSLQFYAATSANSNIYVFFNGYWAVQKSMTPTWQLFTIPFSSMNPPASLGNPAGLVFMNGGNLPSLTLYLYNVAFL